MSRSAALAAVAHAVDVGGDIDVANAALSRHDPLRRRGARRLVRDAYVDALVSTQIKKGEHANRHVMRLAYLGLAGTPPDPAITDDPDAILAAFDHARRGRPAGISRVWWASALLVLAIGGAVSAASFASYRIVYPRRYDAADRAAPPPRGAFAGGGKPAIQSPAVAQALGVDLPDYLIAVDQWSRARREGVLASRLARLDADADAARARILAPPVRAALGEGASKRLEQLLDAARDPGKSDEPQRAPSDGSTADRAHAANEPMMAATGAFDDELAAAGLGYFVDGDVITDLRTGHRLVIIYAFTVESVSLFTSNGATIRALDLRRLDHLNWSQSLLGFTRPHLREALVLLDQVDEQLVTYVLPGLGKGSRIELFDPDDTGVTPALRDAVEGRAGELVRAEYGGAPGLDSARAERLGRLLTRRRELFESFEKRVSARGLTLRTPDKLRLDKDYDAALAGAVPQGELDELRSLDDEVGEKAFLDTYARLRDVLVDSVERHEAQHRIDYGRQEPLPMPAPLEALVGPAGEGESHRFASQTRAELSAYLGELSRDERTTKVNLTMISRFLFKKQMQGMAESYSAVVIFEGLAAELGVPHGGGLVTRGNIQRERAAEIYLALTALPEEALRGAAGRLWAKLFEGPLPELRPVVAR
jgi:hypothetical protein